MKITLFLRFLFATLFPAFAWVTLSSYTLANGIYSSGTTGNDISYPECSTSNFLQNAAFGIVGATGGRAFTDNPCLSREFTWASSLVTPPSLYMNLNSPIGPTASEGITGPYDNCARKDKVCQAENYGYNAAQDASLYAANQGVSPSMWWLDIESTNSWSSSSSLNQETINGAVQFFKDQNESIGIYSTPSMWSSITGGYQNNLPVWIATGSTDPTPYCSSTSAFTGGIVHLVQYAADSSLDTDYAC